MDAIDCKLGAFRLKGLGGTQEIIQLLPADLSQREFPPIKEQSVEAL